MTSDPDDSELIARSLDGDEDAFVEVVRPSWITSAMGSIPNLWAPDISYFGGL